MVFLQCTSPAREPSDIDAALHVLESTGADSLLVRVGFRMHSRLYEMCEFVEFEGADYRHRPTNAGPDDLLTMWINDGSGRYVDVTDTHIPDQYYYRCRRQSLNIGDINGDGFNDFAIGDRIALSNRGRLNVFFGRSAAACRSSFRIRMLRSTRG